MLGKWLGEKQEWAPLLLRVTLGVIFFAHGAQKVLGWYGGSGWAGTMQFFTQALHIPAPLAVLAFLTEFLGGAFLIVGLFTRWAALLLAGEMVVATLLVHLKSGFFMNWTNAPNVGHGIEYNLALVGASLALVLAGGGRFSLDGVMAKWRGW